MKSNNASGGSSVMSELAVEMKNAVIALAGERRWNETRQRWLERAARRAGITYRSARALFYCEPHQPRAAVLHKVRAAVERKNKSLEANAHNANQGLLDRLARIEAALMASDPDFYSEAISAIRDTARQINGKASPAGNENRSLARGEAE